MGRDGKPWYREARNAWYVEIDGKQVRLALGKANRKAADAEFRRLASGRDGADRLGRSAGRPTVGALVLLYVAEVERRAGAGELSEYRFADVVRRLADFPDTCGAMLADAIRPKDVNAWLSTKAAWGPTTRADAVVEIRGIFRWAKREGHVETEPLAGLRPPPRRERREHVIDAEAAGAVAEHIVSPAFRDLWCFLWWTGCRPKEARTVEARHVDWERGQVVRRDHKTARSTRRDRVIPLPWQARFLLIRRAERWPDGPLFRNERGHPWTKDAVHNQIWRLRTRAGVSVGLVVSALRHVFGTALMEKTGDVGLAAAVLGHASTAMLTRVYSRLDKRAAHLLSAVDGLHVTPDGPPDASPAPNPPASRPDPTTAATTEDRPGRPPRDGTRGGRR